MLKKNNNYKILKLLSEDRREEAWVTDFEAYHTSEFSKINNKLKSCSLVVLSIFPKAFEQAASNLSVFIKERALEKKQRSMDILVCSNIPNSTHIFRKMLENHLSETEKKYLNCNVGLASTIIIRVATEADDETKEKEPLTVVTNGYP